MADLMKGTPLEGFELPDDVFGLGAAELAYLMSRHETPAGERSRACSCSTRGPPRTPPCSPAPPASPLAAG